MNNDAPAAEPGGTVQTSARFARLVVRGVSLAGEAVASLFYPRHCIECGVSLESQWLCSRCKDRCERIVAPRCERCSQPFHGAITSKFVCANCASRNLRFDCAISAWRARGPVREWIHRFKYGRQRYLRAVLADLLLSSFEDERLQEGVFDALIPVPLHPRRERERGFNQAQLLAITVGKQRKLPVEQPLRRTRYTSTQTALHRGERMENLRAAFALRQNARVHGRNFLLVDDVFTTGATLDECARVLRAGGASTVMAITVARA